MELGLSFPTWTSDLWFLWQDESIEPSKNDQILRCDPLVSARWNHRFSRKLAKQAPHFQKKFKDPTAQVSGIFRSLAWVMTTFGPQCVLARVIRLVAGKVVKWFPLKKQHGAGRDLKIFAGSWNLIIWGHLPDWSCLSCRSRHSVSFAGVTRRVSSSNSLW